MRDASADRTRIVWAGAALAVAVGAIYANSLNGAFVLDDTGSIVANDSIRHLWPLSGPLQPPADAGVGGRPFANLTFAVNYAIGGLSVRGYHAVNLLIHAANALLLFGLIRRTLLRLAMRGRFGDEATAIAFSASLLWALHPLQTSVVAYVSQRTESLMALFYLGTMYGFVRGMESRTAGWRVASVVACALGMATKEVMVTAPVAVFLYDWVLVSGGAPEAWRRNRALYLALASTWIGLAALLTGLSARAVGYGLGVAPWRYALTQCSAIVEYLKLALWPHPLIFDRGQHVVPRLTDAAPAAFAVAMFLIVAGSLWWRCRKVGFLAAIFFALLAPSSSIVPIVRQPIAENRMYLPLAALTIATVLGAVALFARRWRAIVVGAAIAAAILSVRRNEDYRSAKSLWADTVAKQPENARAYDWLGMAQLETGDTSAASATSHEAVRLAPTDAQMHNNLALALAYGGKIDDAVAQYNEALRLRPGFAEAHSGLGYLLLRLGRVAEARTHLETAIRLRPDYAEAYNHLGLALPDAEAVEAFGVALRLQPNFAEAHNNLAAALFRLGRRDEALAHFEEAVRLKPDYADARTNLEHARAAVGRAR